MSFLVDLLADIFTSGLGPSTSRGMMGLGLIVGVGLCAANGWLLMTASDPLREPAWAFGVIVIGNMLWVAESFLILGQNPAATMIGKAFVIVQAVAVAGLALLEAIGLLRLRSVRA